jgi:PAP2 superfamily
MNTVVAGLAAPHRIGGGAMSNTLNFGRSPRVAALAAATALAVVVPAASSAQAAEQGAASGARRAEVVRDWNEIAVRTIVTENAASPGVAQIYLGFVSSAVYDAVRTVRLGHASQPAAVGTAAHDVLVEYFPSSADNLAADLEALLASIPDGARENRGVAVGAAAADRLIASRVGDGRDDTSITLDVEPAPGVWRPTPPGFLPMATPWAGFMKPLLLRSPTSIDVGRPDRLTSNQYAADYREVKSLGAVDSTTRTPAGTENALFWNFSVPVLFNTGVRDWAAAEQLGARATARAFALLNMTVADSFIVCWRAKYDRAYWRPITAIREGDTDGNPATTADPNWTPLVDTPPYPDWPSGHGYLTSAYLRGLQHLTGSQKLDLTITNPVMGLSRHYTSAAALASEASISRIQLGIHFRDAMEDAYRGGRLVADRGLAIFRDRFSGNR